MMLSQMIQELSCWPANTLETVRVFSLCPVDPMSVPCHRWTYFDEILGSNHYQQQMNWLCFSWNWTKNKGAGYDNKFKSTSNRCCHAANHFIDFAVHIAHCICRADESITHVMAEASYGRWMCIWFCQLFFCKLTISVCSISWLSHLVQYKHLSMFVELSRWYWMIVRARFFWLQTVVIHKAGGPLGLSIVGGADHSSHPFGVDEPGVFVSKVTHSLLVSLLVICCCWNIGQKMQEN